MSVESNRDDGLWTEDDVQRLLSNPIYCCQSMPSEVRPLDRAAWMSDGEAEVKRIGPEQWLKNLVRALEGRPKFLHGPCDPRRAVVVAEMLTLEHEALVSKEQWINVNALRISSDGFRVWADKFLDVLGGAYV